MTETLLTVEQAAERLQLGTFTVREQLRTGRLRGLKRGRVWRVPESALFESSPRQSVARQADELWAELSSDEGERHNAAIVALAEAPQAVRALVLERSSRALAEFYASDEGQSETADWRALDGEPFIEDNAEAAL